MGPFNWATHDAVDDYGFDRYCFVGVSFVVKKQNCTPKRTGRSTMK